jgi:hypothetical protein
MRRPWIENGYLQIPTGKGFYMGIPLSIVIPALAIAIGLPIVVVALAAAMSSKRRDKIPS